MLRKNLLNSKVLKQSSVEPAKQWPRGSSVEEGPRGRWSILKENVEGSLDEGAGRV